MPPTRSLLPTFAFPALTTLLCLAALIATSPADRPAWDQQKAEATVQKLLAVEAAGELPWDRIEWLTDPAEAAARAGAENKPIFLYFYLEKPVGPAEAPG